MRWRAQSRGQSLTEMALIVPMLVWLMLGAADLGRAFYLYIEVAGASRAGLRNAVFSQGTDIGDALRSEPNTAIPNTAAAWGSTGPSQPNSCGSGSTACGDTAGCPPSSFQPNQFACFAVRYCAVALANGGCQTWSLWNQRPPAFNDYQLDVRVVYQFTPVTPLIASLASGGVFYLTSDTTSLQHY